jgi:DNA polymerase III delta prime subunit
VGKIVGQKIPLQIVHRAITENRLPHLLLIHGEEGVGKFEFAMNIAKTLACTKSENGFCEKCESCLSIHQFKNPAVTVLGSDDRLPNIRFYLRVLHGGFSEEPIRIRHALLGEIGNLLARQRDGFLDLLESEKKSFPEGVKVKVADMEESSQVISSLFLRLQKGETPTSEELEFFEVHFKRLQNGLDRSLLSKRALENLQERAKFSSETKRVFIIPDIQKISAQIAPSLLKLLEEPPPQTYFILIAPGLHLVSMDTMVPLSSRACVLRFLPILPEEKKNILTAKYKLKPDALSFLQGSGQEEDLARLADQMVENCRHEPYNIASLVKAFESSGHRLERVVFHLKEKMKLAWGEQISDTSESLFKKHAFRLLDGHRLSSMSERNQLLKLLLDLRFIGRA